LLYFKTFSILIGSCLPKARGLRSLYYISQMATYFNEIPKNFINSMGLIFEWDDEQSAADLWKELEGKEVASAQEVNETIKKIYQIPKYKIAV